MITDIKEFNAVVRKDLIPKLKSKGFNMSVASNTQRWEQSLHCTIKSVPKSFSVWSNQYNRYDLTENADKLRDSIKMGIERILREHDSDFSFQVSYDRNLPYKEIENA